MRKRSIEICAPLQKEDYVVQPVEFTSPPKWHLGHTTWFFETFVLEAHMQGYKEYNAAYNFIFNSYYETLGARVIRTDRGNLSRPSVDDVYAYRQYVDEAMQKYLATEIREDVGRIISLGLNHEQQHQELLYTDIKYILGHNPLFPSYGSVAKVTEREQQENGYISIENGVYEIGCADEDNFCFDNELNKHKVFVQDFQIAKELITNKEYLEFMNDGGYRNFSYWHSEGWEWVKSNNVQAPLYWHLLHGEWQCYTLNGLAAIDLDEPVCHVSYYEATAFAAWKGMRLPTEQEWEIAARLFKWGTRWEWTESAYLPYPGYAKDTGAIGEYNGKFMVNQMVLRGASIATSPGHSRLTYRNFFHPHLRWQFSGIRLASSTVRNDESVL